MVWPRDTIGDFHKRYVLITGCDSGFGKAIAIRLDKLGFNVFAACLTKEGQEFLTVACSERMKTFHLDVTISESIQDAFNFVKHNIPPESGQYFMHGMYKTARVRFVETAAFRYESIFLVFFSFRKPNGSTRFYCKLFTDYIH